MRRIAIGDIHGCFHTFMQLLEQIQFSDQDELWSVGDLVNRGPHSLEVLRFLKSLPATSLKVVLGNHDFHLLAAAAGQPLDTTYFEHILNARDKIELIEWLRHRPMLYHEPGLNYIMTHAGIPHIWTLREALGYAKEVEQILQSDQFSLCMTELHGNEPACWHPSLHGWSRIRCLINYYTRMRFCTAEGRLELSKKMGSAPQGTQPWFEYPRRADWKHKIIFGHWSTLKERLTLPHAVNLDTGCVWGGSLTAYAFETGVAWSQPCQQDEIYPFPL